MQSDTKGIHSKLVIRQRYFIFDNIYKHLLESIIKIAHNNVFIEYHPLYIYIHLHTAFKNTVTATLFRLVYHLFDYSVFPIDSYLTLNNLNSI